MKEAEKLKICIQALKDLTSPKGSYSLDRMEHAENTIKDVAELAAETLKKIGS